MAGSRKKIRLPAGGSAHRFKYIGEQIGLLEKPARRTGVFGFEESYGYLSGTYVRDKDRVVASMLVCEMAAYYKKQGKNLRGTCWTACTPNMGCTAIPSTPV